MDINSYYTAFLKEIDREKLVRTANRLPTSGMTIIDEIVQEYARFIVICAWYVMQGPDTFNISPSTIIDSGWHANILDTRSYRMVCERVFGFQVDHHPDNMFDTDEEKAVRHSNTIDLYCLCFHDAPDRAAWLSDFCVQENMGLVVPSESLLPSLLM